MCVDVGFQEIRSRLGFQQGRNGRTVQESTAPQKLKGSLTTKPKQEESEIINQRQK